MLRCAPRLPTFLALVLAPLGSLSLTGCATPAPPAKLSWSEAGLAPSNEAEENAVAEKAESPEQVEARLRQLSPLGQSTVRFGGVERALRARFTGQPMPEDARRAWSGLFAAVDQTLSGELRAPRADLLRAKVAASAELEQDKQAYPALPAGLEAAIQARVRQLGARLGQGKVTHVDPDALAWPLDQVVITSLFGPRLDPLEHSVWKRHDGVDLSAPPGKLVMAAGRGVVVDAGWRAGYGLTVAVRHPGGAITRYGHLSQLLTRLGMELEQGGAVGLVGSTGRSTGPHLHFEIWRHGRAVDPLSELGDPEVVADADPGAGHVHPARAAR